MSPRRATAQGIHRSREESVFGGGEAAGCEGEFLVETCQGHLGHRRHTYIDGGAPGMRDARADTPKRSWVRTTSPANVDMPPTLAGWSARRLPGFEPLFVLS